MEGPGETGGMQDPWMVQGSQYYTKIGNVHKNNKKPLIDYLLMILIVT